MDAPRDSGTAYIDGVGVQIPVAVEVVEAVHVRDPVVAAVDAAARRLPRYLLAHVHDHVARLAVRVALP